MLNQTTQQQAIILLYSSNPRLKKVKRSLMTSCYDNKLSIVKIIKAKDEYDYKAFAKLCHIVSRENNKQPISLIIDESSLREFSYFLSWMIIGTLQKTKLINKFYVYYEKDDEFENDSLIVSPVSLFNLCSLYFQYIPSSLKTTMFDWKNIIFDWRDKI